MTIPITKMKINTTKIKSTFKRSLFGDFDGDGVMNAFDCQPKNKRKQDSKKDFEELNDKEEDLEEYFLGPDPRKHKDYKRLKGE